MIRPGMHSFRQKALGSLKAKIRSDAFDGCAVYIQTLPTRQESSASSRSSSDEEEEIPEDYVACLTVLIKCSPGHQRSFGGAMPSVAIPIDYVI